MKKVSCLLFCLSLCSSLFAAEEDPLVANHPPPYLTSGGNGKKKRGDHLPKTQSAPPYGMLHPGSSHYTADDVLRELECGRTIQNPAPKKSRYCSPCIKYSCCVASAFLSGTALAFGIIEIFNLST